MDFPIWQLPESLRELEEAGDRNIVRDLISEFRRDSETRLERMHAALQRRDAVGLKSEAHSLCGSASQMGANAFAAVCREIEAEAPGLDWATLETQVGRARPLLADVVGAMSRELRPDR